jgi:hypothetical protein
VILYFFEYKNVKEYFLYDFEATSQDLWCSSVAQYTLSTSEALRLIPAPKTNKYTKYKCNML